MKLNYPEEFYLALLSYENTGVPSVFIPTDCWGATGWVAVKANDEDQVWDILKAGTSYLNLKLIDIEEIHKVYTIEEVRKWDDHLASNLLNWEPGKRWVIGTVRGYYGEGTG